MKPSFFLCAMLFVSIPLLGQSNEPADNIAHQGYLTSSDGTPLNETVQLTFRIYRGTVASSASLMWTEVHPSVSVVDGVYEVELGSITSIGTLFGGTSSQIESMWLGVQVASESELVPRSPINAVPYAHSLRGFLYVDPLEWPHFAVNVVGGRSRVEDGAAGVTIAGGGNSDSSEFENQGYDDYGTIGGGFGNTVGYDDGDPRSQPRATVAGGHRNIAREEFSTVGGGERNNAFGQLSVVSGGSQNEAAGGASTVSGGLGNRAWDYAATVAGGRSNFANSEHASIGGGRGNVAAGLYSVVPGGLSNDATGHYSFAAGHNAAAVHAGTFVWSDSGADSLYSTANDQFIIDASGGVGIGTNAPQSTLDVAGPIHSSGAYESLVLYHGTNASGSPNGDGFRIRYEEAYFGNTLDALVIEKTDGNANTPDGGIVFVNTGEDTVVEPSFVIRGNGNIGVGTDVPATRMHVIGSKNESATESGHIALLHNDAPTTSNGPDVLALKSSATNPNAQTNFLTFFDATKALGRIEGDGAGGVTLNSGGADYAEYLPVADGEALPQAGEVVGVKQGVVDRSTEGADRVMVVSSRPIVLGNRPADGVDRHVPVAFVGQVAVRVKGPVAAGDYLVPSGDGDGYAVSVNTGSLTLENAGKIVGRVWSVSRSAGELDVIAEVGLDRADVLVEIIRVQERRLRVLEEMVFRVAQER